MYPGFIHLYNGLGPEGKISIVDVSCLPICQRSSDQFYIVTYYIEWGHYFLNIQKTTFSKQCVCRSYPVLLPWWIWEHPAAAGGRDRSADPPICTNDEQKTCVLSITEALPS